MHFTINRFLIQCNGYYNFLYVIFEEYEFYFNTFAFAPSLVLRVYACSVFGD